jgi:hypothetical protein
MAFYKDVFTFTLRMSMWWGKLSFTPTCTEQKGRWFPGLVFFGGEDKNFLSCMESKPDHPANKCFVPVNSVVL